MPKTPELNRLVERMNQTIMKRVRNMLAHAKLPKTFWAEALTTSTYVINRSPSVPLDGTSPQKVWTGKEVSGIVLNRKRISTKKEVLLVLTGLRKTPEREREREREREEKRARDSEDERERER